LLPRIKRMRLRLVREPFDNPEYLMEWKADGFRAIAYVENGEAKLVSRNLKSLRFESLGASLAKLPVANAILDGEIVCLDANGVSQFNWLLSGRRSGQAIFYAFDLLWLDGADLRESPNAFSSPQVTENKWSEAEKRQLEGLAVAIPWWFESTRPYQIPSKSKILKSTTQYVKRGRWDARLARSG